MHPADLDDERLLAQCEVRRVRRGGPGGQHRNKTSSAVVLKHRPTGTIAEANERRDQSANLRQAIYRLRVSLALETRSRRSSFPSDLWRSRCGRGRISVDSQHDDFPRMLAEALDALEQQGYEVAATARLLDCTASQLVRLLSKDPRGMGMVNARRRQAGLPGYLPRPSR